MGGKLDDFERSEVASELLTGVSISSSQAVLKLGIASVVLVGVGLMVSGQVGFLTYFGFLLVVTRVYDPVSVVLQSSSELLEMRHAIGRTNDLAAHALHGRLVGVSPARLRPFLRGRVVFLRGRRARA